MVPSPIGKSVSTKDTPSVVAKPHAESSAVDCESLPLTVAIRAVETHAPAYPALNIPLKLYQSAESKILTLELKAILGVPIYAADLEPHAPIYRHAQSHEQLIQSTESKRLAIELKSLLGVPIQELALDSAMPQPAAKPAMKVDLDVSEWSSALHILFSTPRRTNAITSTRSTLLWIPSLFQSSLLM